MPRRKPNSFAEKIGQRVAHLRMERKLTQEQLGYGGGIAKGSISELERGLVRPSVPMLKRLAEVLEVEVVDLLTFPEHNVRHQLIDATRKLPAHVLRHLLAEANATARRSR